MKTTAGRIRNLSLEVPPLSEVVFVLPDGSTAELDTAVPVSEETRHPKTGKPMLASRRLVLRLKVAAAVPAVPA